MDYEHEHEHIVIARFRDKNVVIARFRDKNVVIARMFGVFAIEEPGSLVPALYATLP